MKVFVAIGGWDHEANDEPIGVYSSQELAEVALQLAYQGYDTRKIKEYTLDQMPDADPATVQPTPAVME